MSTIPLLIQYQEDKYPAEVRINEDILLTPLKEKLYRITGCCPSNQRLELHRQNNTICVLEDESKPLSHYLISKFDTIKVIPINRASEGSRFEYVPKYEISQEAYMKRTDNAVYWLKTLRNNSVLPSCDATNSEDGNWYPELAVGDRVVIKFGKTADNITKGNGRHGNVAYVGPVNFQAPNAPKANQLIGIIYDNEGEGSHNGTVNGTRYFTTTDKRGEFVRRKHCYLIQSKSELSMGDDDECN